MDASRRDAVVAQAEAFRRRLAREAAAASARAGRTASEQAVFDGATEATAGHAALAQNEVLADTTPSRRACDAAHHQGLDGPMSAAEEDELVACPSGFARRRSEAGAEVVAARMRAFLRRTDLDTMSVRSVAVGTGTPGAARHDCTVKMERPDVELRPLPSDGMDSDGALRDIVAEVPADQAPTEASGVSGRRPVTEADIEVTSSVSQFEVAAGLGREGALEVGLVRDSGEQAKPYAPDGTFQGAHRMDATD